MAALILISGASYMILLEHADAIEEIAGGTAIPKSSAAFLLLFVSASMFPMLSSVFTSIAVCDDYESRIVKNIFARGYSRTSHYFAKLIYVFTVSTVMFLFALAISAAAGIAFFGFEKLSGKLFVLLFGQYVVCMSGVAMSFAVAAAIKKLGGAIAVNIIVPIVIPLLLQLVDSVLELKNFRIESVWTDSFLTSLTDTEVSTGRVIACVLGAIAYTVAFIAAGYAASRKTEV